MVEVRVTPRRIRKNSKSKIDWVWAFPRLLLALRAANSKILAPGGTNTAMAYRRTNFFPPSPLLQSGERTSPRSRISQPLCDQKPTLQFLSGHTTCHPDHSNHSQTNSTDGRHQLAEIQLKPLSPLPSSHPLLACTVSQRQRAGNNFSQTSYPNRTYSSQTGYKISKILTPRAFH